MNNEKCIKEQYLGNFINFWVWEYSKRNVNNSYKIENIYKSESEDQKCAHIVNYKQSSVYFVDKYILERCYKDANEIIENLIMGNFKRPAPGPMFLDSLSSIPVGVVLGEEKENEIIKKVMDYTIDENRKKRKYRLFQVDFNTEIDEATNGIKIEYYYNKIMDESDEKRINEYRSELDKCLIMQFKKEFFIESNKLPRDDAPRAIGLWLWDYIVDNFGPLCVENFGYGYKRGAKASAYRELKKNISIDKLGYKHSDKKVLSNLLKNAAHCIELCTIIPIRSNNNQFEYYYNKIMHGTE